MKCPHCLENFFETWDQEALIQDKISQWYIRKCKCASCKKAIIEIGPWSDMYGGILWHLVHPKGISRAPLPTELDDDSIASDYSEACLVLSDSPKASAALSRRCLQYILREKAGIKHSELSNEIQEVVDSNILPSDLGENLDYVRMVGNFAAHPIKSKSTGIIFDVEPGEAEHNLNVIEELIDYYFVRPARLKRKKEELNIKLKEAGKPELPI